MKVKQGIVKKNYSHYEFDNRREPTSYQDLRRRDGIRQKNTKFQTYIPKYKSTQVRFSPQNYVYKWRHDNHHYRNTNSTYNSKFQYHPIRKERESSPIDGSDELTQRKIQETSDMIKRQLMSPENSQCSSQIKLPELPQKSSKTIKIKKQRTRACELQKSKQDNLKKLKLKAKKRSIITKPNISYNVKEIHTQIMNYFLKLNDGRRQNLINANITSYDTAIQQIYKKKSLELSQALREMSHQEKPEASEIVNSIIPDFAIKFEELPVNVIRELSSCFENFVNDGVPLTESVIPFSQDMVHDSIVSSSNDYPYMDRNQEVDRELHLNTEDHDSLLIKTEFSLLTVKEETENPIEIADSDNETDQLKNEINSEVNTDVGQLYENYFLHGKIEENLNESIDIKSDDESCREHTTPSKSIVTGTLRVCTDLFDKRSHADDDAFCTDFHENEQMTSGNYTERNMPLFMSNDSVPNNVSNPLITTLSCGFERNYRNNVEKIHSSANFPSHSSSNIIDEVLDGMKKNFLLKNKPEEKINEREETFNENEFNTLITQNSNTHQKRKNNDYETVSNNKITENECYTSGQCQNVKDNKPNNFDIIHDIPADHSFQQVEVSPISNFIEAENSHYTNSLIKDKNKKVQEFGVHNTKIKIDEKASGLNSAEDLFPLLKNNSNVQSQDTIIAGDITCNTSEISISNTDIRTIDSSLLNDKSEKKRKSNEFISVTVNSICKPKTFSEAIKVMLKIDKHIEYLTKLRQNIFISLNNEDKSTKNKKQKKKKRKGKKCQEEQISNSNAGQSNVSETLQDTEKRDVGENQSSNSQSDEIEADNEPTYEEILNSQFEIELGNGTVVLHCEVIVEENMIIVGTNTGEIQYFNIKEPINPLVVKLSQHEISCLKIIAIEDVRWVFTGTEEEPLLKFMRFRETQYQTIRLDDGIKAMRRSWQYIFIGGPAGYLTRYNFEKKKKEFEDFISDMKICKIEASKEGPRRILVILLKDRADSSHIHVRDAMSALHIRTIADNIMKCENFFLRDSFAFIHTTKEISVFNFCDGQFVRNFMVRSEEEISNVYSVNNHLLVVTPSSIYTYRFTNDVRDCYLERKIPCDRISSLRHYKNEIIIYGTWSNKIKALRISDSITPTSVT